MSYSIQAAGAYGSDAYTIPGLVRLLGSASPPAVVAFPSLGNPARHTIDLVTGQGAVIQYGVEKAVVRAIGLSSCASVCYTSNNTGASYVYHCNVGLLSRASFDTAMEAIGTAGSYGSVFVALAHPDGTGPGYQQSVQNLVAWGVPTGQVVEISNVLLTQFGLNNSLQMGY